MALRWTECSKVTKGFRPSKAHKHLPAFRAMLLAHQCNYVTQYVEHDADAG
jgi:hypothetical protein